MVDISSFNYFEYNGHRSIDFNVFIQNKNVYSVPERSVEEYSIPGRNGSVVLDNANYSNEIISFDCVMIVDPNVPVFEQVQLIKKWLCKDGAKYKPLKSSFFPLHTKMAAMTQPIDFVEEEPEMQSAKYALFFTVYFNCKPQNYINEYLNKHTITTPSAIVINTTDNIAEPYINLTFTPTATVGIGFNLKLNNAFGEQQFVLTSSRGATHFSFDAETHKTECDGENSTLTETKGTDGLFPKFYPGENILTVTASYPGVVFKTMEIIERLWEL